MKIFGKRKGGRNTSIGRVYSHSWLPNGLNGLVCCFSVVGIAL